MASNFYTTPCFHCTDCTACNAGYMAFSRAIPDPRALREEFRRRPFNAPRRAQLYVPNSLNHFDIASLSPAVQPGQEAYFSPTETKGFPADDDEDDEGWGTTFLRNFFMKGFLALLSCFIGLLSILAVPVIYVFKLVAEGLFLPVFAACSVYWYITSLSFDSFVLEGFVLLGTLGVVAMTVVKFVLGR